MPSQTGHLASNLRSFSRLCSDLVNPAFLQLLHLRLELLHLLPAVQRPAVVLPQAADDLAPRALHAVRQLADLLPLLELAPQRVDLLAEALVGQAAVLAVGRGVGFRDLVVGGGEGLGALGVELLQLGGDAGLDLELDLLGAGCVGLRRGKPPSTTSSSARGVLHCFREPTYLVIRLQRID